MRCDGLFYCLSMKRVLPSLLSVFVVLLFNVTEGWSADFDRGYAAWKNGDYATALREFTPPALQGDHRAQLFLGAIHDHGSAEPLVSLGFHSGS